MKFKIGDVLGLSPTSQNTYEVTEVHPSAGMYGVISQTGHRTVCTMIGYVLRDKTHLYKMGDIVQWRDYDTKYEIVRLYEEEPNYYDFKSEENVIYEHMMAKAEQTYLVPQP